MSENHGSGYSQPLAIGSTILLRCEHTFSSSAV